MLATVSDIKFQQDYNADNEVDSYTADIITAQDYYPFGMLMTGRTYGSNSYKFGFNGQELDNEVTGVTGSHYTAEFWEYDSRLGRRWNLDPAFAEKPWMSTYHAFSNKPIINIDPNGALDEVFINGDNADEAFKQLQASTSLCLTRNIETGKIEAEGESVTDEDKKLLDAINSTTIKVDIKTNNTNTTSSGQFYTGGAFMGNGVIQITEEIVLNSKPFISKEVPLYNSVIAKQEVNPKILAIIDSYFSMSGSSILHEVTEAYEGAKISQKTGISSTPAGYQNSVYNNAHEKDTEQPGPIYRKDFENGYSSIYLGTESRMDIILNTFKR